MPPHSDLVEEAKLETSIFPDYTQHTFYRRGISGSRGRIKTVEQWKRRKYLGNGAYGTVWLESCDRPASQNGPKCRAVKEIPTRISKSNDVDYSRELEAITKFSQHRYTPFFVQSFGWFETPEAVFITMEYMDKGDLENYLKHPIVEEEAKTIAFQLVQGLQYMHTNGFTHRDLKPKNILVVVTGPDWLVQISDFGISRRLRPDQLTLGTINKGTLGFVAPEMLGLVKERGCPHASDIWSLGAVIFRMVTKMLFLDEYVELLYYAAGLRALPTEDLDSCGTTPCLKGLLGQLLAPSPTGRPAANEILIHEWFSNILNAQETDSIQESGPVDGLRLQTQSLGLQDLDSGSEISKAPSARWTTDAMPDKVAASSRTNSNHSRAKSAMEISGSRTTSPYERTEATERGDDEIHTIGGESTIRVWARSPPPMPGAFPMNAGKRSSMPMTLQGDYDRNAFDFAFKGDTNTVWPECINRQTDVGCTLLNEAANQGYVKDAATLLDMGADYTVADSTGMAPLQSASANGHVEVAKLLLSAGADIETSDRHGYTVLMEASLHGHVKVVSLLLQARVDIEASTCGGRTALHEASRLGHHEVVSLLLKAGADTEANTDDGLTPLYWAFQSNNPCTIRLLLEAGADSKSINRHGYTALHEASFRGYDQVVSVLLKAGVDIRATDDYGRTALHAASCYGRDQTVSVLLEAGVDIEARDRNGNTALHNASESYGCVRVVSLLLKAGVDIESQDPKGNTALHNASKCGDVDTVRLLLEAGACAAPRNSAGKTPEDLSLWHGSPFVLTELRNAQRRLTIANPPYPSARRLA